MDPATGRDDGRDERRDAVVRHAAHDEPALGVPLDGTLDAFGPVEPVGEGWLIVRGVPDDRVPALVEAIVTAGGRVHAVDPGRRSLEDLFLNLVREPRA